MEPVVLVIVGGLGATSGDAESAIAEAATPVLERLRREHAHTTLRASGEAVGLRPGDAGSSESGYLTIGAGRAVPSQRHPVDASLRQGTLRSVPAVAQALRICLMNERPLHLVGLLSDAGLHSQVDHLEALIASATEASIPVFVHAILDGRDVGRRTASQFLERLEIVAEQGNVRLATIGGRAYGMACDGRWDLSYQAFHAIVRDKILGPAAPRADTWFDALSQAYASGLDDETVPPTRLGDYGGLRGDFLCDFGAERPEWAWFGEDVGLAFNFRGDRMRQLVGLLSRQGVPDDVLGDLLVDRDRAVHAFGEHAFSTLTDYGSDLALPVAFPSEIVEATLGATLEAAGLRELRCGESEGEASFTAALSGRLREARGHEVRRVVPSPRLVERWTEQPAMSTQKVARYAVEAIRSGEHALIVVDFVAPDALAHSRDVAATVEALEAVDAALGTIVEAAESCRAKLLLTSTHGHCEALAAAGGGQKSGHTTAPVPVILVGDDASLRPDGSLADVAPTVLDLLGIAPPAAMTGRSLRQPKSG